MSMIDVIRKEMMTAMKNKDKERKESHSAYRRQLIYFS